jgi:hypothetical protein
MKKGHDLARRLVAATPPAHAEATRYTPKGRTRHAGSHNPQPHPASWLSSPLSHCSASPKVIGWPVSSA